MAGRETSAEIEYFSSSEGLRTLLEVIAAIGSDGWRRLPAATELLQYAQRRFRTLAIAWHRPAADATYAAFLAMRAPATRKARDPWAVIGRAVFLSLVAETQAERMLLDPEKARRPENRPQAVPVRAGDSIDLVRTSPRLPLGLGSRVAEAVGGPIDRIVSIVASLLVITGWSPDRAQRAVEYICSRIPDLGSLGNAADSLRRDHPMRLRLGLSRRSWNALLTLLIGGPTHADTSQLAVLARTLLGDSLADLLCDPSVLRLAHQSAPRRLAAREDSLVARS